jgi:hypothetical protein
VARLERLQKACDAQRQRAEAAEAAAAEQEAVAAEARQQGERRAQRASAQVCSVTCTLCATPTAKLEYMFKSSTVMLQVHERRHP